MVAFYTQLQPGYLSHAPIQNRLLFFPFLHFQAPNNRLCVPLEIWVLSTTILILAVLLTLFALLINNY